MGLNEFSYVGLERNRAANRILGILGTVRGEGRHPGIGAGRGVGEAKTAKCVFPAFAREYVDANGPSEGGSEGCGDIIGGIASRPLYGIMYRPARSAPATAARPLFLDPPVRPSAA